MTIEREDVAGGGIVCLFAKCEQCGTLLNEGGADMDGVVENAEDRALEAMRYAWRDAKRWGYVGHATRRVISRHEPSPKQGSSEQPKPLERKEPEQGTLQFGGTREPIGGR